MGTVLIHHDAKLHKIQWSEEIPNCGELYILISLIKSFEIFLFNQDLEEPGLLL